MKRPNRIDCRCGRGTRLALAALGAGLSLGVGGGAGADEPSAGMLPVVGFAERLPPANAQSRPPRWLGENWFYRKQVGLEYRWELKLGDRAVEFGLQGPLMQRRKRAAGATVEIRF
jgi:hypothetical protein